MKKLLIIFAILFPVALFAQNDAIDKLFEKYANKEGFTTVSISGKMLNIVSGEESDDKTSKDILSKLSGIRVLSVDNKEITGNPDFYNELKKAGFFKNTDYEVLMEVTDENEVVRFLGKDDGNGKFSELILVVGGDDNAIISIRGTIDPDSLGQVTKSLNLNISK